MHRTTFDSKPINCGRKGKGLDWSPLKERMLQRLGQVPSLSVKLTREELEKLGFTAAAYGLYSVFQGGYDGRGRADSEERVPVSRG